MLKIEGQQNREGVNFDISKSRPTEKLLKERRRYERLKGPTLAVVIKSLVNLKSCQIPSPNN